MNDVQRGLLAERMLPRALQLVGAVRESPAAVTEALTGLTHQEALALLVVLAALVPDDRTVPQLLAWSDPDMCRADKVASLSDAELRPMHARWIAYRAALRAGKNPPDPSPLLRAAEKEYQRRSYQRRVAQRQPLRVVS